MTRNTARIQQINRSEPRPVQLRNAHSADRRHFGNMHGGPNGKEEWLTPPELIRALGRFDLDPASPVDRPWPTALHHFTALDDGLRQNWFGRVWLNPPYGSKTGCWMKRLADHGNGIALTFARTETRWFHSEVWQRATAVFFFRGRLLFYCADGRPGPNSAGAPSCLVAYGGDNARAIERAGLDGWLVKLR